MGEPIEWSVAYIQLSQDARRIGETPISTMRRGVVNSKGLAKGATA